MLKAAVRCVVVPLYRTHCSAARPHGLSRNKSVMKPKVLVTDSEVPEAGIQLLATECEVVLIPGPAISSHEDIVKYAKGVDAIMWVTKHKLDSTVIDAAGPGLRAVSTMSAGVDNVDVQELKARGLPLGNTPDVLSDAVADIGIALLLTTSRRLQEARRAMDEGTWPGYRPRWLLGQDVSGSTVGIVGLGGIGQAFAKRISGFNIGRLLYTGRKPRAEATKLSAEFVSFDKLITESDFILISCPLTKDTKHMFNDAVFKKMKPTSIVLNVARGGCIDQDALVRALKNNVIWGAGLDVMEPEPIPKDHPLLKLPNCVLFPHIGSATKGTRAAMATLAAKNIMCALRGENMPSPVN